MTLPRKRLLAAALVLCAGVGLLEAVARLVQHNRPPLLPYSYEDGASVLPGGAVMQVWFRGYPSTEYVTDALGARVADRAHAATRPRGEVLVLGDSQALGYMIDFPDTFASRVAAGLVGDGAAARMLAAPATQPESEAAALARYARPGLERQRLGVIALNLGNDLDEMYLEPRNTNRESPPGALRRWLLRHSFLYMDLVLIEARLAMRRERSSGVNPVLYLLDTDERVVLARAAVRAVERLAQALPAEQKVILLVPQDFQVDGAQFQKYRRYYRDRDDFDHWNENIPALAQMLNSLEGYIGAQLRGHGYTVIGVAELLRAQPPGRPLFDASSHHLTARAHRLIADAMLAAVGRP